MNKKPKVSRPDPETMSQAQRWDTVKSRYVRAGVCDRCAAHAAWGHQLGFSTVKPSCVACVPVVATFPTPAVGGWRKLTPGRAVAKVDR